MFRMMDHAARVSALGVGDVRAADQVEGLHTFMLAGDAFVEHQGVGHDGAGHAAGLGNVGHAKQPGNLPCGGGGLVLQFVQDDRRLLDAALQRIGGQVHLLLGNGDEADKVCQVGDGAFQPARFGEAGFVLVEDAVGEAGIGDGLRYVVGVAHGRGVAQGDGGFDGAGLARYLEAEPVGGVLLRFGGGVILGFDHHRGAARRGYQHVGVAAGMGGEGLGVLGEDLAVGHHGAEAVAEGVVGVGFGLLGHVRGLRHGRLTARV